MQDLIMPRIPCSVIKGIVIREADEQLRKISISH